MRERKVEFTGGVAGSKLVCDRKCVEELNQRLRKSAGSTKPSSAVNRKEDESGLMSVHAENGHRPAAAPTKRGRGSLWSKTMPQLVDCCRWQRQDREEKSDEKVKFFLSVSKNILAFRKNTACVQKLFEFKIRAKTKGWEKEKTGWKKFPGTGKKAGSTTKGWETRVLY
jgi:hypothetical protein